MSCQISNSQQLVFKIPNIKQFRIFCIFKRGVGIIVLKKDKKILEFHTYTYNFKFSPNSEYFLIQTKKLSRLYKYKDEQFLCIKTMIENFHYIDFTLDSNQLITFSGLNFIQIMNFQNHSYKPLNAQYNIRFDYNNIQIVSLNGLRYRVIQNYQVNYYLKPRRSYSVKLQLLREMNIVFQQFLLIQNEKNKTIILNCACNKIIRSIQFKQKFQNISINYQEQKIYSTTEQKNSIIRRYLIFPFFKELNQLQIKTPFLDCFIMRQQYYYIQNSRELKVYSLF